MLYMDTYSIYLCGRLILHTSTSERMKVFFHQEGYDRFFSEVSLQYPVQPAARSGHPDLGGREERECKYQATSYRYFHCTILLYYRSPLATVSLPIQAHISPHPSYPTIPSRIVVSYYKVL